MSDSFKSGFVTLIGRPNVGKSTLMNRMIGQKIAITSSKPQTTRNRVIGIVNRNETQFVLMDTPGFIRPRNRLGDYMVSVVKESIADVDACLFVVEPAGDLRDKELELIERFRREKMPVILVINKVAIRVKLLCSEAGL